jgi:hypothetical protein
MVLMVSENRVFPRSGMEYRILGDGQMGGKAVGLDRSRSILRKVFPDLTYGNIEIDIPGFVVISTRFFELFTAQEEISGLDWSDMPDERIAHAFQQADLSPQLVGDLWGLIREMHRPLAVRSSSLLEDALRRPFAGVYLTKMIPNNEPAAEKRFAQLSEAIRLVYASTFFGGARDYVRAAVEEPVSDKMAVILQEVVGARHGDRFYPDVSGVARSYNYYPYGSAGHEDGVVQLALGLGKTIVDGGVSWSYCPRNPRQAPPTTSIDQLLKESQLEFWAVNMGKPPAYDPVKETEYLQKASLADADYDDTLASVASTYDGGLDMLIPGTARAGPRAVTFAPILDLEIIPLNKMLKKLMAGCEEEMGSPVEIEFALTMSRDRKSARFGLLQVRPMVVSDRLVEITDREMQDENTVIRSESAMGNGVVEGVRHIVYVKPDAMDMGKTRSIAAEVSRHNRELLNAGNGYIVIGFGRWGSSDPWLGIPVRWEDIAGVKAIVEAGKKGVHVDMSQGSHFFHNLCSFQVPYLSTGGSGGYIDWEWIEKGEIVLDTEHVRTVVVSDPLRIGVDGRTGRGVVIR